MESNTEWILAAVQRFSVELRVDITLALYISMNTNFASFEAETTKNM